VARPATLRRANRAAEPLYYVQETATAPLLKYSHVRLPCPSQPFLVQRPRSYPNLISDLIDCGDAFSKTGTFGSGTYSAAAVSVGGGWYDDPESGPTLAAAPLFMLDCLLVSAGGGTGVACTSGGTEGAVRSTASHLFHSCIAGFETDLKMDTSGAWEPQSIKEVEKAEDIGWLRDGQGNLVMWMTGAVEVWGYSSPQDYVKKAEIIDGVGSPPSSNENPYSNFFVVLRAPSHARYAEPYGGAPPVIPLRLTFRDGASEQRTLFVSFPPALDVSSGVKVLRVGSAGETFWHGDIWPPSALESMTQERLASEWAEMWTHASSFQTSSGMVSVDPTSR